MDIQMIGVTMRKPMVFCILNCLQLRGRNFVVMSPAAKVGVPICPGIGGEYRRIVIGNNDRVTNSLEEPHRMMPFYTPFNSGTATTACIGYWGRLAWIIAVHK